MVYRRQFLLYLASCAAAWRTAQASLPSGTPSAPAPGKSRLVLHKGWILRADDPIDINNKN